MALKVFLDVNIIVDFFLESRTGHKEAVQILSAVEDGKIDLCVSETVINTSVYLTRKSVVADVFKKGINDMLLFGKVLPCNNNTVHQAYLNAKNDLEDAVLYQIALENKMEYFVTSDIKDYKKIQHPLLPVVTAKQLLKIIKDN